MKDGKEILRDIMEGISSIPRFSRYVLYAAFFLLQVFWGMALLGVPGLYEFATTLINSQNVASFIVGTMMFLILVEQGSHRSVLRVFFESIKVEVSKTNDKLDNKSESLEKRIEVVEERFKATVLRRSDQEKQNRAKLGTIEHQNYEIKKEIEELKKLLNSIQIKVNLNGQD